MTRHSRHRKSKLRSFFHHLKTVLLFGVGISFLLAGIFILWASFIKLPDFNEFHYRKIAQSTKIYDRTGEILLYDVHQDVKRTVVPFEEISPWVKKAVIAIEDNNFYTHGAVSFRGIARAVVYGGTRGGGSTITQQVVKKTLLTDEKIITRKLKEIILAYKLEQAFSKDEILALYLNEIPYGGSIYGINEASLAFFGKTPANLTLAQSAYLAAIPNAPTYYSPYGNNKNKLDERKNLVLSRMRDIGSITQEEFVSAQSEVVEFLAKEPTGMKAPHFVEWVKEYLAIKYGEIAVEENGYRVITTLDYVLQQKAEETVNKFGPDIEKNFTASNMAVVAIDPTNGQVLAMVGSRDFFDVKKEGNFNVALAHRQPGSTFKPFVYASAFMKGYTPETVLFDLKTNFSTNCDAKGVPYSSEINPDDCYMPENYDGKFRGPVSMREALAQSLNIPAVKTLYLTGIKDALNLSRRMGIQGLGDANQYGLTLVLGGGEVSLLDLTSAYGVFANDGVRNPTVSVLRIEDAEGKIIEEFQPTPDQVLPNEVARKITNILADNVARTPEFGANSALYFPGKDVAVKTGTTNDFRDVWTVGYTPRVAIGMWAGNNNNSPIFKNIAGFIITPAWHYFMNEAMKLTPAEKFIAPEKTDLTTLPAPLQGIWQGGEKFIIDRSSGKLATYYTPLEMRGTLVVPSVHTILHWINKNDPLSDNIPTSPQNDPQYTLWETPVHEWSLSQNFVDGDRGAIPSEYDTNHSSEASPVITLSGSDLGIIHKRDEVITISITTTSLYPVEKIEIYVNNQLIGTSKVSPYTLSFVPSDIDSISSNNTITVVAYDSIFNKGTMTSQLIVE